MIKRPYVIGVTGSAGKTTTKEAIRHLLAAARRAGLLGGAVGASDGNLNSETGLPLAVLRFSEAPRWWLGWLVMLILVPIKTLSLIISAYPRYLVLEYAADQPGDIARLVRIARPKAAVVTSIGPAHLALLGSVRRVGIEKLTLVRSMPAGSPAILGSEIQVPKDLKKKYQIHKIHGKGEAQARVAARVMLQILGVTLSDQAVRDYFDDFKLPPQRMNTIETARWFVIDDAYNANPLSMRFALEELSRLGKLKRGRRVAILGDMLELGRESLGYHRALGDLARTQADLVIAVGPEAKAYQAEIWYPTARAAREAIRHELKPQDVILVKGSRGVAMEQIVDVLVTQDDREKE